MSYGVKKKSGFCVVTWSMTSFFVQYRIAYQARSLF